MSYFLLGVPYESDPDSELRNMKQNLSSCECYPFRIPDLKVGTLDSLMSLSDDLVRTDTQVEAIMTKTLKTLQDMSPKSEFVLKVEQPNRAAVVPQQYIQGFQWDEAQLPINKPLKTHVSHLVGKANKVEEELKVRHTEYNQLKTSLDSMKRKEMGSLSVKPLAGIVKKEHSVESEYLTTLYVCVPSGETKSWLKQYETFTDYVVPGSSERIASDNEYELYNVVLFRKIADDFANQCKEHRFIVRDFTFDETQVSESKEQRREIEQQMDERANNIIRLCQSGFNDVFFAWTHLKAIRLFVECVLRYGVPPQFCSALLKLNKSESKVHREISQLYKRLEISPDAVIVGGDNTKLNLDDLDTGEKYYPYVYLPVDMSHPGLLVSK